MVQFFSLSRYKTHQGLGKIHEIDNTGFKLKTCVRDSEREPA